MGYLIGLCLCILVWKVDRNYIWHRFIRKRAIKDKHVEIVQCLLIVIAVGIGYLYYYLGRRFENNDIVNAVTIFLTIELNISGKKEASNKKKKKKNFYRNLSSISDMFIFKIVAPLIYIAILGNCAGIIYTYFYYASSDKRFKLINHIFEFFNIIPSIYAGGILYIIYILRNRTIKISFNGEYFRNLLLSPMLNIYIMAAYIESVNFYYIVQNKKINYMKVYGEYQCKIDMLCITDYLSIAYGIAAITFAIFMLIVK